MQFNFKENVKKVATIGTIGVLSMGLIGCTQTVPEPIVVEEPIVEDVVEDIPTDAGSEEPVEVITEVPVKVVEEVNELFTHWDNDYEYGDKISVQLGDSKVSKLIDEEIKFDGEDIEVEEYVTINAEIKTSADGDKDFDRVPYMVIDDNKANTVGLSLKFKDDVVVDDIEDDEKLNIVIAGQAVSIISLNEDEVVFDTGVTATIQVNNMVENVKLVSVSDVSRSIIVEVDGVQEIVEKGETEEVNGIEVECIAVVGNSAAKLRVGKKLNTEIEVGDEMDILDKANDFVLAKPIIEDGVLKYFGIVNSEDVEMVAGEQFKLPNDYLVIDFEVSDADYTRITLDMEDIDEYDFELSGEEFSYDNDEYDVVYGDGVDLYDEDDNLIASKVVIGDSDYEIDGSGKISKNGVLVLDLVNNPYDRDEDVLTEEGIILYDTEAFKEDQEQLKVDVPQDEVEVTLNIKA